MANHLIDELVMASIAQSIRNKLGVDTKYKPSEMPAAIDSIVAGGSSGGGSNETCSVDVDFDGPMIGDSSITCHYVNGSGEYKTKTLPGIINDIQKNSILSVYSCSSMYTSSDTATRVGHEFSTSAFYITGDGYISFQA